MKQWKFCLLSLVMTCGRKEEMKEGRGGDREGD